MSALVDQRNGRGEGPGETSGETSGGRPDDGSGDRLLGRLLEAAAEAEPLWRPEDLSDIWLHQLAAPAGAAFDDGRGGPSATFDQLLHDPSPSATALERVKQLAKAYRSGPDPAVPPEVATALYFAAIAAALVRCGRRITSASDHLVRDGMQWAAAHPWLDGPTRLLLETALQRLATPPGGGDGGSAGRADVP